MGAGDALGFHVVGAPRFRHGLQPFDGLADAEQSGFPYLVEPVVGPCREQCPGDAARVLSSGLTGQLRVALRALCSVIDI